MSDSPAASGPHVTGKLIDNQDDQIVLGIPGSDYQLHLVPQGTVNANSQGKITGTIRAKAQRVDVIASGGRYIEPVYGRPRRIQGRISGGDPTANTITVQAGGAPITATLMAPQTTADFMAGQMVSFDVERGATFEQQS